MERQFDQQINKLKTRIIKMCSLVDEQIEYAIKAIDEDKPEYAQLVKDRENKVNKHDVKIEKICQKIFALNQPVAMDLRLIMSALTINTNLERIGDIAVNLSDGYLRMGKKPEFIDRTNFYEMAKISKEMLRNAIDSFIENNAELAQKVIQSDQSLDDLNFDNRDKLITIMKENPDNIATAVEMLVISRQMERIGDHATNIAEDVYFIVEAEMIKHKYEKFLFDDDSDAEDEGEDDAKV